MSRRTNKILGAACLMFSLASCAAGPDCGLIHPQNSMEMTACRANRGDKLAQYAYGMALMYGQGVAIDRERAVKYFRAAAADKRRYEYIFTPPTGDKKYGGLGSVRSSIERYGLAGASYELGLAYLNGWGVRRDREKALELIREAAQAHVERAVKRLQEMEAE